MADREKVIELFSSCISKGGWNNCTNCEHGKAQAVLTCKPLAEDVLKVLKEQQPKTGHWLKKMSNYPSAIAMGGSRTSACDSCGGWGRKTFKYCPHCGAKMTL